MYHRAERNHDVELRPAPHHSAPSFRSALPPSLPIAHPSAGMHSHSHSHPHPQAQAHPHSQTPTNRRHNHHPAQQPYSRHSLHSDHHPIVAPPPSSMHSPTTPATMYYDHPPAHAYTYPYHHDGPHGAAVEPAYEYEMMAGPTHYGKHYDARFVSNAGPPHHRASLPSRSLPPSYSTHPSYEYDHDGRPRMMYDEGPHQPPSDAYYRTATAHGPPMPPPHTRYMDGMSDPTAMMQGPPPIDQQPTYIGYVKSSHDAILLLSACDIVDSRSPASSSTAAALRGRAYVPPPRRVTRRLLDAERADMVASGCVFAWDEKEAGMKRWTDGRVWSASRVSGCFLTYRELEARKKSNGNAHDGPTSNQYKPEGLIKQSFSVTTASGRKLHVISYFTKRDIREGRLRRVSEDPRFVGEGGGEWNLKVDQEEYSFPDGHHHTLQNYGRTGSPLSYITDDDRDEEEEGEKDAEEKSKSVHAQQPNKHGRTLEANTGGEPQSAPPVVVTSAAEGTMAIAPPPIGVSRKRSVPDEFVESTKGQRPPSRPTLWRMRSSSLSGSHGSSLLQSKPTSFQSSTSSHDTSIAPDTGLHEHAHDASSLKLLGGSSSTNAQPSSYAATAQHGRSSVTVRALVSPTLPRESAIRGSACDMQPTQSQDNASAVGALLSLAGSGSGEKTSKKPSPLSGAGITASGGEEKEKDEACTNGGTTTTGLGLSVKPTLPERRDSDQNALNKFSVRL